MQLNTSILKTDEKVAYALRSLYHRYGYSHYKMRKFEEYELYAGNKDFLISDAIISFTDTNGKLLALKPDVTLSIINNSLDMAGRVQKLYYDENVYRLSKGSRSYNEIKQTGLECIGDVALPEVCEVVILALRSLEEISPNYIFEISHIGLMETVLAGLELPSCLEHKVLGLINRKNTDGLNVLFSEKDVPDHVRNTLSVFTKNFQSFDDAISSFRDICSGTVALKELEEFSAILDVIKELGYEKHTKINFSLTNDMNYYSGVAFRGYIQGIPTGVLSGGQYDKLMRKMNKSSKAIGFAVYLDALKRLNPPKGGYDADILLLHNGKVAEALKEAHILSAGGKVVRICAEIPKELTYDQVMILTEKGVTEFNGND